MKKLIALAVGTALAATLPATPAHAEPTLGEIKLFGFNFCPRGYLPARGQLLAISSYSALFSLYGTMYGGDGRTTFGLPDLSNRAPIGLAHSGAPGTSTEPGTVRTREPREGREERAGRTMTPVPGTLTMSYCVATVGIYPSRS